jgi:hypothetical protein
MTRPRLALLLILGGALALVATWWLLRSPEPTPGPPVPAPVPPVLEPREAVELLRRAIEPLRQGGVTRVPYLAGSSDELESYRGWLNAELRFATQGVPPQVPPPVGFRSMALDEWGQVLAEELQSRRGAGAFVLRTGAARPLLIEVPHSFFDEGTLDIGLQAFVSSGARGLLVNTVHRYRVPIEPADAGAPGAGSSPSDLARAEASFFLTAHAACVDALLALEVVQLHGFADAAVPAVDVIVSAAGSRADPVSAARALERALGIRAAAYPTEIRVLGGTLNRQAKYSIAAGGSFLHVEMSRSVRDQLTANPARLSLFIEALLGPPP